MRIALVDDCASERTSLYHQIMQQLITRNLTASIEEFSSGEDFLHAFLPAKYDIVFLDIYMQNLTGMEVAKMLFAADPACKIVFLTSSPNFALDSYSVHATYYLLKPLEAQWLKQALDFCLPAKPQETYLPVRTKQGTQLVSQQQVFFIESVMRHGVVHLENDSIESADGFAEITAPLLTEAHFLTCGRGIMVNMQHIDAQEGEHFTLRNGCQVPISRRCRAATLQAFQDYALSCMHQVAP